MSEPAVTVADAPDAERYELRVDSELSGILEYRDDVDLVPEGMRAAFGL